MINDFIALTGGLQTYRFGAEIVDTSEKHFFRCSFRKLRMFEPSASGPPCKTHAQVCHWPPKPAWAAARRDHVSDDNVCAVHVEQCVLQTAMSRTN
jgi:hypothetical protein